MLRTAFATGLALITTLGWVGTVKAAAPCPISLQQGTDIGTIDGTRGTEWDDAATLASLNPSTNACLNLLMDEDGTFRPVTIRSKSYADSTGAEWIGFFFEVQDSSVTQSDGSALANGEVLVVQLDPDLSEGAELSQGASPEARDWKLEVRHFWASQSAADPDAVEVTTRLYDSSGDSPFCALAGTSLPFWNEVISGLTPATTPQVAVRKDLPGGYTVEIAIPKDLIGNPAEDIGVALGIVNDHGSCADGSGVCDGHGLAFPSDLPVTNADNPVIGCGHSWIEPDTWATGFAGRAPGDVTLSHAPRYWLSEDVDALACGNVDNNYYPNDPCRMQVRVNLRNASPSDQIRNILVLKGDHGAGVVDWSFVDLIEGVNVPASGEIQSTSVEHTDLAGLAGHPCIRAYALPPTIDPAFDLARMQSINTAAELADLVETYGLRDVHSAQQNISRRPDAESCPDAACAISAWLNQPAPFRLLGMPFVRTAQAQEVPLPEAGRGLFTVAPADHFSAKGQAAGILAGLSDDVGFDPETLAQMGEQDAVVEFVALGYRAVDNVEAPIPDPRHNFLEVVGGAVDRIPLERIAAQEAITLGLNVGNPADVARHIGLSVRVFDPSGSGLRIALSEETLQAVAGGAFAPFEARPIQVAAGLEDVVLSGGAGQGLTNMQMLLIFMVLLLILLVLRYLRRSS